MGLRVSESWGAAGRERAARWLTGRAAPSVGCVCAVRVGLKRREGGSACWAAGAGEGEECDAGRAAVTGRAAGRKSVRGEEEKEKGSWAVGAGLGQGEWCWAGGKRERADRAGPAWEKVKRWVRPGFKLGWVSFGLLWVWV